MNPDKDFDGGIATLPKPAPSRPMPRTVPVHENWDDDDDDEKESGFKKYRVPILVAAIALIGIIFVVKTFSKSGGGPARQETISKVLLLPPPPPPPPPETMKEEKMIEAEKEPEPEADPGPPVQTALKGPATGGMSVRAGNSRPALGSANAMSKTARWTAYAGQVQSRISDALRNNARTRKASARITVRVWVDSTGRITRAT